MSLAQMLMGTSGVGSGLAPLLRSNTAGAVNPYAPSQDNLLDLLAAVLGQSKPPAQKLLEANARGSMPPQPNPGAAPPGEYSARMDPLTPAMDANGKAGALDPHQGGGLIGNMFGWNGNPLYEGIKDSGILEDLGYGLVTGTNFGDALGIATRRTAELSPQRDQERRSLELRRKYTGIIGNMGPEYQEYAQAVQDGIMEPNAAYFAVLEEKRKAGAEAEEINRAGRNAVFLKDPTLQELVRAGALDFKEAWKMETDAAAAGGGGDFGDTIVPGLDEAGNLVPMRANPQGGLSMATMPEGVRYAPDALAGARAGGIIDAKTLANAKAALPGAEQTVAITMDAISTLRNDKQGQEEMFNGFNRYFGSTKGTPMANFEVNLSQASGQAFLQARQMLKGGGAITDFEGKRAEAAYSRLGDAAEKGDLPTFLDALDDFERAVVEGYQKLQQVAAGTYQPTLALPGAAGGGGGGADPLNLFGGQ